MKKIGRVYREKFTQLIQKESVDTNAVLFVNFKNLSATQMNILRAALRQNKARLLVAKNRLIRRAFQDSGLQLDHFLKSETGIVYSSGDVVEAAKVLFDFRKEYEKLEIKGGFIKERLVDARELEGISNLPSRSTLLGMAVNCIASPLIAVVNSLNQIILRFVWAIEEIKKQKDQKP